MRASFATHTGGAPTPGGRAMTIAVWGLQILLALLFLAAAVPKLSGASQQVAIFTTIGVGQWFRYAVGAAELAGAIGLLIPRLAGVAALGLAADMIGATAVQAGIFHSNQWLPASFLVLCALVAWARWPWTMALARMVRRQAA